MLGPIDPLYSLSGFFVGLLVGQTGMGGGALMTPLLILVFAYVYYMVSRDLYTSERLVWAGIWGKMASASADLYFLVFKTGVAHIFWTTVCTDYIFVITFFLFTRWVRQQKDSPQLRAG